MFKVDRVDVTDQHPNGIGSGELSNPTPDMWFDKTALKVPSAYSFGNTGAHILHAGPVRFLDLSLSRSSPPQRNRACNSGLRRSTLRTLQVSIRLGPGSTRRQEEELQVLPTIPGNCSLP
jgi:hypothetical protein